MRVSSWDPICSTNTMTVIDFWTWLGTGGRTVYNQILTSAAGRNTAHALLGTKQETHSQGTGNRKPKTGNTLKTDILSPLYGDRVMKCHGS